jgi:integrase/recombinase XerD
MSELSRRLEEYLTVRRGLGFKLVGEGWLLASFVAFAEEAGARTVTTDLALAWSRSSRSPSPVYVARRYRVLRGFARWLQAFDPATQVPPEGLLPGANYRPTPYLYSDADIAALMAAARTLSPELRCATFETLIGLLAATGLRIGEAMRLDRDDVDWDAGVLYVRDSKFGKSREVLVHASTIDALRAYSQRRDQLCAHPSAPSLFISTRGTRLLHTAIYPAFRQLLGQAGIEKRSPGCRPRVHGLRHSFAVSTLLRWYRDGGDVEARIPLLSTYMGHIDPAATYWYLSAVPELLALGAERLERAQGQRR